MAMSRDSAFEALGAATQEMYDLGRRITAAGLKVRLRQRTCEEFDEKQLGFSTFRAFLREAVSLGVVQLHEGGVDIFVTPAGRELPAEQPAAKAHDPGAGAGLGRPPRRVRGHLWRAFVDWTPGTQRFFDRTEQRAFSLPGRPSPREHGEQRARREAVAAEPQRFVKIAPIPFDEQLGWMHDFADRQQSPIKEQLQLALASDRPARDFTAQVRAIPALYNAWHRAMVEEVAEAVECWATTHEVEVDVFEQEQESVPGPVDGAQAGASSRQSRLRAMLHRAIDRMPEHELGAIALPARYLVESSNQR